MKAMIEAHRWLYANKEPAVDFLVKEMNLKPAYARIRMGILLGKSPLASGRGRDPGGTEIQHSNLFRTNPEQGTAAHIVEVRGSELSKGRIETIGREMKIFNA